MEIREEILKIQDELQIKDAGMADLMELSVHTYKNCKSLNIERNNFNSNNLENLKKNLSKKVKKLTK